MASSDAPIPFRLEIGAKSLIAMVAIALFINSVGVIGDEMMSDRAMMITGSTDGPDRLSCDLEPIRGPVWFLLAQSSVFIFLGTN